MQESQNPISTEKESSTMREANVDESRVNTGNCSMNIHDIGGHIDTFDVNIDDHHDQQPGLPATSPVVDGDEPTVQTRNCSMNVHDIGGDVDNCDVNIDDNGDQQPGVPAISPIVVVDQPTGYNIHCVLRRECFLPILPQCEFICGFVR